MIQRIKEYKVYIIIGAVLLGMFVYFLFMNMKQPVIGQNNQWTSGENNLVLNEKAENHEESVEENIPEEIIVDVKGAVHKPGVYKAKDGDRVVDIIERAGGLKDSAEEDAVNFAMRVSDEMVLYIPKKGENVEQLETIAAAQSGGGGASGGGVSNDGKVNLNKASNSELETLPGIGPAKAQAIIDYREQNGPFKAVEDLISVSGIGEKTFEKLKDQITVR